jgi:hypothetical protein
MRERSARKSEAGSVNPEPEESRVIRKFVERLEAFRLACKQVEVGAEELEKFFREKIGEKA